MEDTAVNINKKKLESKNTKILSELSEKIIAKVRDNQYNKENINEFIEEYKILVNKYN